MSEGIVSKQRFYAATTLCVGIPCAGSTRDSACRHMAPGRRRYACLSRIEARFETAP